MFIQRFFKIQNYCFASQTVLLDILSFLTVNQQNEETKTSKSPGWATQTIFSVARGQASLAPSELEHSLESLSSSTLKAYFSLLCWRSIFFLLVQSNLTCTWFEVAANKNHTIFSGRARDTGKLKNQGNFWLPRRRKECAPEFKTLADYVIPRNKQEIPTSGDTSKNEQQIFKVPWTWLFIKMFQIVCNTYSKLASDKTSNATMGIKSSSWPVIPFRISIYFLHLVLGRKSTQ